MPSMEEVKEQLKPQIIKYLNLIDVEPHEIGDSEPFFGDSGLGLDSVDSFELLVLMEREYGIKIEDPKYAKDILVNVNTMASHIANHGTKFNSGGGSGTSRILNENDNTLLD